jgi:hypothetical protein
MTNANANARSNAQKESIEPEVPSALIDNEASWMKFDVAVNVHKAARKKLVDTGAVTHTHSQDALHMLGLHDPLQRTRRLEQFGGARNVPAVMQHLRNPSSTLPLCCARSVFQPRRVSNAAPLYPTLA